MSHSALAAGVRHLRRAMDAQRHRDEGDEQLLRAFIDRREDSAFAVLVRRHGPMVMGVCRRVLGHQQDAEDAFQATFLVLARNAAVLHKKTALASFLHGTAYRTALAAKRAAARRRKHERQAPVRQVDDPSGELLWREVRALLDEEIVRLPEIYRSVFVLCCLEGSSQAEAARGLGVKEATVSSRLAGARKRLQMRLSRRGVDLTALLAATALTTETASALPPVLMAKTIEGAVSPTVAALADSIPLLFSVSKIKLAMALVLAASVLSGAGLWAYRSPAAPPAQPAELSAARASDKPKAIPPQREAAKTVEIQGRVLGPDGKPKTGVKLLWLSQDKKVIQLGTSATDGRFTVAVPIKSTKQHRVDYLVAQGDGDGIDFLNTHRLEPGKPVELRLVKDHMIRGRIISTEGKPIAGAHVAVNHFAVYANNSLDDFFVAWMKRRQNTLPDGVKEFWDKRAALLATTTDADGRFVLHGVGAERLVRLHLHGAGIADEELWIVNRDGFDPKPYNKASRDNIPKLGSFPNRIVLSGPDVPVVAESEKIICGVVKDADSGKGLTGVTVWLPSSDNHLLSVLLQAKTDAAGRYEIRGARKAKSYVLQIQRNSAKGYLGTQVVANNATGYQPITVDITLKKGVIVTGKMIDLATGQAVPGHAHTAILHGNPFTKEYPKIKYNIRIWGEDAETGEDGTFRDVTIPGPVLLMGDVDLRRLPGGEAEFRGYKPAVPDPEHPKYFTKERDGTMCYFGLRGVPRGLEGNFCKVLDIKPGTAVVHQDIFLERESVRTVKIRDAEGRPLTRAWATGLRPEEWPSPIRLKADSCPAYALEANKQRLMVFYERDRKLAGSLRLTTDQKEPLVAKLGPAGAIRGRLLDADGKPLAVAVDVHYRDHEAEEIHKIVHEAKQAVTDAAGAFTLDELIPELKFELSFRRGKRRFALETKPAEATIQVKPGECRDLGAIKLKQVAGRTEE